MKLHPVLVPISLAILAFIGASCTTVAKNPTKEAEPIAKAPPPPAPVPVQPETPSLPEETTAAPPAPPMDTAQVAREALAELVGELHFATNEDQLSDSARSKLSSLAEAVSNDPSTRVNVDGYTDNQGSDRLNQDLSRRRAQAVASVLQENGVPADRIKTRARAESDPIAPNSTPQGRAENRRAEVSLAQ